MELAFSTKILREICEIESSAIKALGTEKALILMLRISDLRAANNVYELISGTPREFIHAAQIVYSVNLSPDQRIIFCPNHSEINTQGIHTVEWQAVNRIKIIEIEGIHE